MPLVASDVPGNINEDSYETRVLREYYSNSEFFVSVEWILKVLAVVVCIALTALFLAGGGCAGAAGLAAGGAAASAAAGAGAALLCAGAALQLPRKAPRAWLIVDITISTVMGVLVLVTAILSVVLCEMATAAGYLLGPLGVAAAGLMTGSAAASLAAVARRLDRPAPARPARPAPPPHEQEV